MESMRARLNLERLEERATPDVGDTLATATATGLFPGGLFTEPFGVLGDGNAGDQDVDMFSLEATAGTVLMARTTLWPGGASMDTIIRLFNSTGAQLAVNDDYQAPNRYSALSFTLPTTGTYYIGISGFPNFTYNPVLGGGGAAGDVGDYRLDLVTMHDEAPAVDEVGDTVYDGHDLGIVHLAGYALLRQALGDGPFGDMDVDIYPVYGGPGSLFVATSPPAPGMDTDTMVRVFNPVFQQMIIDDDSGQGFYSLIHVILPEEGWYFIGVSGFSNNEYNPEVGGSGESGETGDYRLDAYLLLAEGAPGGSSPGSLDGKADAVAVLLERLAEPIVITPAAVTPIAVGAGAAAPAEVSFVDQPPSPSALPGGLPQTSAGRLADQLVFHAPLLDFVFASL
jgi:Bacterial pre-peptidase C-terminal domain